MSSLIRRWWRNHVIKAVLAGALIFVFAGFGTFEGCDEQPPNPGSIPVWDGPEDGASAATSTKRCKPRPLQNIRHEVVMAFWTVDPFDFYPIYDAWVNTDWCWRVFPSPDAGKIISRHSNPDKAVLSVFGGVTVEGPSVWSSECSTNMHTCLTRFQVHGIIGINLPGGLPNIAASQFRCITQRIGTSDGGPSDHSRNIYKSRCSSIAAASAEADVAKSNVLTIQDVAPKRVADRVTQACNAVIGKHCVDEVLKAYQNLSPEKQTKVANATKQLW